MCKTLQAIIVRRISTHLEEQNLLPTGQKGCHPGNKGCMAQLMISKARLQEEDLEFKYSLD